MNADISASPTAVGVQARGPGEDLSAEEPRFDVQDALMFVRRRYRTILAGAVLGVFLGFVGTTQMTPQYESTATVLIDAQDAQVVDIEAVLTGLGAGSSSANAQTAIITSRAIAERVADRLSLWQSPEFNGENRSLGSRLNPLNWFGGDDAPVDADIAEARARERVIALLRDRMVVRPSSTTQTVEISYESSEPQMAASIANAIADEYALDQLEAKFEATKRASDWLSRRLETMRLSLDAAERAVETYRSENNLINADGLLLSEQELSQLNSQLILIRAEKAEKMAVYARAQQLLSGGASLESVSEVIQSPVITALRQQQAQLARKQADLASRYGDRHPQMINVRAERRDLDAQIQQEISRIVDSLKNSVEVVRTRERSIEQSLEERRNFAAENNQSLVRLRALEREADATRALYETFLTRFKEVNEQETLQTSGVRIISPAVVPTAPSSPRTNLILVGALIVGFGLGSAMAFGQELLDDTFHTAKQIEQVVGVPNIGVVPQVKEDWLDADLPDYVLGSPLSPYVEAFRSLRTSLELSNVDAPPKVILITSAVPSEGKTSIATSFALAAAHARLKTVIVDCDLRKPRVHKVLGGGPVEHGLVEYLAKPEALDSILRTHEPSGADFVPIAAGSINPTEILGSQHMSDLIEDLRKRYDLVVLDSAPLLPVADSRVVANLADTTVLVVRWGKTARSASRNAANLLRQSGQRLAGTVLSAVDMDRQAGYGYGDTAYTYGNYNEYYKG